MDSKNPLTRLYFIWKKEHDEDKSFLLHFALSFAFMVFSLNRFTVFVDGVDARPGVVLTDPILNVIPPIDVTWWTFVFIYGFLIWGIVTMLFHPRHMITATQTYGIFVLFRWFAMYLVPLEPPEGIIILKDPIVESLGTQVTLTKDLFFSGHTSTVFMVCLNAVNSRLKTIFFFGTLLVGACVIVQHVHYTIDVFAAFFFTFASYRISINWQEFLDARTTRE